MIIVALCALNLGAGIAAAIAAPPHEAAKFVQRVPERAVPLQLPKSAVLLGGHDSYIGGFHLYLGIDFERPVDEAPGPPENETDVLNGRMEASAHKSPKDRTDLIFRRILASDVFLVPGLHHSAHTQDVGNSLATYFPLRNVPIEHVPLIHEMALRILPRRLRSHFTVEPNGPASPLDFQLSAAKIAAGNPLAIELKNCLLSATAFLSSYWRPTNLFDGGFKKSDARLSLIENAPCDDPSDRGYLTEVLRRSSRSVATLNIEASPGIEGRILTWAQDDFQGIIVFDDADRGISSFLAIGTKLFWTTGGFLVPKTAAYGTDGWGRFMQGILRDSLRS